MTGREVAVFGLAEVKSIGPLLVSRSGPCRSVSTDVRAPNGPGSLDLGVAYAPK